MRPATAEERKQAVAAIEAQLQAFRDNDYEKAAKYQSESLRKQINTPEAFRAMMERSYPQFARSRAARFGEATASPDGNLVRIDVTVTGQDGVRVGVVYLMVKEEGSYRVGSVLGGVSRRDDRPPRDIA
jgi:hypothetical protein